MDIDQIQIDQFLQDEVTPGQSDFLAKSLEFKVKASEMTSQNLMAQFDLEGSSTEVSEARDAFQLNYPGLNNIGFADPNYRVASAARAIISGVSRCVSVEVVGGLDSHFEWSQNHGREQQTGFNAMANLILILKIRI